MKFSSCFDKHERKPSEVGCRYKDELQLKIRPDGSHEFINVGKNDIYMEIQSHKDSCDIHWVLDHFVNNPVGLSEQLHQRVGQYIDTTDYPRTYAEMLQRCIDARNFFYSLSPDIREKFNHSVDEFISQIGTEKWNDLFMPKEVSHDETTISGEPLAPLDSAES